MNGEQPDELARLAALEAQLQQVKALEVSPERRKAPGDAARAAIDFASATAVGSLLGYGLDAWQHTSPWGLLGGLLLGTAAGVKMMLAEEGRRARAESKATENKPKE